MIQVEFHRIPVRSQMLDDNKSYPEQTFGRVILFHVISHVFLHFIPNPLRAN